MADRDIQLNEIDPPADPAPGEVQVAIRAVALNHIDVWGWRGMAFAKRKFPIVIGAEAAGEIVADCKKGRSMAIKSEKLTFEGAGVEPLLVLTNRSH